MEHAYVDANVLLRFLTKDPQPMWEQALATMAAAARGEIRLILTPTTLAEVVWTLSSFYGYGRAEIGEELRSFINAEGLDVWDQDTMAAALTLYRDRNLDFADALLAAYALSEGPPLICTFDRDFRKVPGLSVLPPGKDTAPSQGESAGAPD